MQKYLVRMHEVALYEIFADSKEEAEKLVVDESEGDFVGYDDKEETFIDVQTIEERSPAWS